MNQTIREFLSESTSRLENAGVDSPRLCAELVVAQALEVDRLRVLISLDQDLNSDEISTALALLKRREQGEPMAYILGIKEFFGLEFEVGPGVLVPRPETELMIESVLDSYSANQEIFMADFGTGSGAIAATLALHLPRLHGVAVDLSEDALSVARKNMIRHGVNNRIECRHADFLQPLFPDESLDLIVSNPPYVSRRDYADLSHEVADFEPRRALISSGEGLDHIRGLAPRASRALKPGAWLFMEFGCEQGRAVKEILSDTELDFESIEIISDLAGLDRLAVVRKSVV